MIKPWCSEVKKGIFKNLNLSGIWDLGLDPGTEKAINGKTGKI